MSKLLKVFANISCYSPKKTSLMNHSIILALGAMIAGALADLIYRVVQKKGIYPSTFLFYQSATFAVTVWLIAIASDQVSSIIPSTWVFGLPIGLFSYLGIFLFVTSLREGKASVNAPIFRLSFVLTSIAAIVILHEPLTLPKVAGIITAVIGVLSLVDKAALRSGEQTGGRRSMLILLAATVSFAIAGILQKEAINQGSTTIPLIIVSTLTFLTSAFTQMMIRKKLRPNAITLKMAPFVGLLQLSWSLLLVESLRTGDVSINFPLAQLSFVLTAILAVFFLKEKLTRDLIVGLIFASLSVISFTLA